MFHHHAINNKRVSIRLDIKGNRIFVKEISQGKLICLSPHLQKKRKIPFPNIQTSKRHLAFISLAARRAEMHVWTVSKEKSGDTQGPSWETSILGL